METIQNAPHNIAVSLPNTQMNRRFDCFLTNTTFPGCHHHSSMKYMLSCLFAVGNIPFSPCFSCHGRSFPFNIQWPGWPTAMVLNLPKAVTL